MLDMSSNPSPWTEALPFLVTHWLANFERDKSGVNDNEERQRALERIRNASAEIASAFYSLGSFGTTIHHSFVTSRNHDIRFQKATFADAMRRWSTSPPSHLEHVAHAMALTNAVVESMEGAQTNLLEAANEVGERVGGGRTVQDSRIGENDSSTECATPHVHSLSILECPSLLTSSQATNKKQDLSNLQADRPKTSLCSLNASSSYAEVGKQTAQAMRSLFELRVKVQSTTNEIHGLNTSMEKQAAIAKVLDEKYRSVVAEGVDMTRMLEVSDEVKAGKLECERVASQLQRKLVDLSSTLQNDEVELVRLQKEVGSLQARCKTIGRSSRDPYWSWSGPLASGAKVGGNPILKAIVGRQQGWLRPRDTTMPPRSALLTGPRQQHFVATRKALLASRLSHAATINTHMSYPVYCLRFDRTGRYFISGADDYLLKVFHLGTGRSCRYKNGNDRNRLLRCNYGANQRGAVLVCSLRGHAGVINDIDVSSDNAFLATASVDGDVRVWGLKDGCPVAILRGHKGGANMVSWSKLTPYRLVSTGSDGFARLWDIREACLKRYGAYVGDRPEYQLALTDLEMQGLQCERKQSLPIDIEGTPLPAIPPRQALLSPGQNATNDNEQHANTSSRNQDIASLAETGTGLVVPPLPAAVPPLPGDVAPNDAQIGGNAPPGQFVANDEIDEGVKLLSKYKHGSTGPEVQGPGTRSRRAAVNVICVARCPLGLFFATGSDDGICRVFADEEEPRVAIVDSRAKENHKDKKLSRRSNVGVSSDEPLLKLMGHVSAITDLSFSNKGDRILSASQKDGVARIWCLGKLSLEKKGDSGVSQIVIKLTDRSQSNAPRRTHGGSNRSDTSKVSCDVAVWTHDDSKIITSQSVLIKQSGSEIQPGSQYIFLWESRTGQCLLGISGAHTMQCPVVVPHPTDSSLVCTAGADGVAKVWDWESGRCIFTHLNTIDFGPVEAAEKNKLAGYLDGSFNSDGTMIVLTDDSGRLTILDSAAPDDDSSDQSSTSWMREQYFANDYYDLYYDPSGYCIERGSERPPHLAPRGARCSHSGSACSDEINEAFSKLTGPSPLPEHICRWQRAEIRRKATAALTNHSTVSERHAITIRRGVREFDPLSTIVIKASGHVESTGKSSKFNSYSNVDAEFGRHVAAPSARAPSRTMSANYRYLDYDDMIRLQGNQDDDEPDSDDEEFNPATQNRDVMDNSDPSDSDLDIDDTPMGSQPAASRRRQNETNIVDRPERARRRAQRRSTQFIEDGTDDEHDEQIMSTNNTPSGPFVRDYIESGHFWRMPSGKVRSKWLKRKESDTSYEGRKIYTPQLGDSIVYIPRAHYETINGFPSLEPPWQRWPHGTAWPVVRCCVRGVRFRFPYQDYYRASQHNSIVAILTLEVTGIPELSDNREYPWPKPGFIEPTRAFVFELSVFENDKCEYIFPEGLYMERLTSLESALRSRNTCNGLPVSVFYEVPRAPEDSPMEASQGVILALIPEEESSSDPHMSGSGFGIMKVEFDGGEWVEDFSPWDLCMEDLAISRPHLSDDERKLVLEALNVQCRKTLVAQHFNMPVDTVRYCDYERMVEIEMCLMAIKRRLTEDYYASKFSVIQDIRLIRDNCIKYNGAEHELAVIAASMCAEFEASVLTDEEASFLKESDSLAVSWNSQVESRRVPTIRINLRQRTNRVSAQNHQANHETRSHPQDRLRRQSSLENLPVPVPEPSVRPRRGRVVNEQVRSSGRHTRSMNAGPTIPTDTGTQARSLRSRGPAPNLESLSRLHPASTSFQNSSRLQDETVTREQRGREPASRRIANRDTHVAQLESAHMSRARTRSSRVGKLSHDSSEEEQMSNGHVQAAATVPSRRSTRGKPVQQAVDDESFDGIEESENESNDDDSGDESVGSDADDQSSSHKAPGRRTRSSRKTGGIRNKARSSLRAKRAAPTTKPNSHAIRKSHRKRSRLNSTYQELSDFEPEEDHEDSESDEEQNKKPRGRTRKVNSYAESSSEMDEDDESDSEDDRKARRSRSKRKRQASPAPKRGPLKKSKPAPVAKVPLKGWPKIEMKHITPVSKLIISKVSEEDHQGVFTVPVWESNPEIADAYLEAINEPMDLRTIEEERIPQYESIKELQDDLILMFGNCCDYNGIDSFFGQYALNLWNKLNEMFAEVCQKQRVSLGRWRP